MPKILNDKTPFIADSKATPLPTRTVSRTDIVKSLLSGTDRGYGTRLLSTPSFQHRQESRQRLPVPFVPCLLSRNHSVIIIKQCGLTRPANFPHKHPSQMNWDCRSTTDRFMEHPETYWTRRIPLDEQTKSEHRTITPENYRVTNQTAEIDFPDCHYCN